MGDSRAVLGSRRKSKSKRSDEDDNTLEVIELTKDQNVHDKEERKRILKAGGFITIPCARQSITSKDLVGRKMFSSWSCDV